VVSIEVVVRDVGLQELRTSRHCLPMRPLSAVLLKASFSALAIGDQFPSPYSCTKLRAEVCDQARTADEPPARARAGARSHLISTASSSLVQPPLTLATGCRRRFPDPGDMAVAHGAPSLLC
jgi:hypothetical protein